MTLSDAQSYEKRVSGARGWVAVERHTGDHEREAARIAQRWLREDDQPADGRDAGSSDTIAPTCRG